MTMQGASYGSPLAGAQPMHGANQRPGELTQNVNNMIYYNTGLPPAWGASYRYPPGMGMPGKALPRHPAPIFRGHPPVGNQLLKDNYDVSRERDHYKSKLYRHEEAKNGMFSGGAIGALIAGPVIGILAGLALGPLWGIGLGIAGALAGGAIGGNIGNDLGDAKAVTKDVDDPHDERQVLNGSPLHEEYKKPSFDPGYYYRPLQSGYRGGYYM